MLNAYQDMFSAHYYEIPDGYKLKMRINDMHGANQKGPFIFKTLANSHDFWPLPPYHRHSSKVLMKGIFDQWNMDLKWLKVSFETAQAKKGHGKWYEL